MHAYIHIHRVLPTTKQDSLLFSYSTHAAFVPIGIFDESGKRLWCLEMFWLGLFTTREMTQMESGPYRYPSEAKYGIFVLVVRWISSSIEFIHLLDLYWSPLLICDILSFPPNPNSRFKETITMVWGNIELCLRWRSESSWMHIWSSDQPEGAGNG